MKGFFTIDDYIRVFGEDAVLGMLGLLRHDSPKRCIACAYLHEEDGEYVCQPPNAYEDSVRKPDPCGDWCTRGVLA